MSLIGYSFVDTQFKQSLRSLTEWTQISALLGVPFVGVFSFLDDSELLKVKLPCKKVEDSLLLSTRWQ